MTEFKEDTYRLRAIVAKEPAGRYPQIVAAIPEDTWELPPQARRTAASSSARTAPRRDLTGATRSRPSTEMRDE